MRINDLVKIRIGKERRLVIGLLTAVNLSSREAIVYRNGVKYIRDLKRVYPLKTKPSRNPCRSA